jgi:hypothetical protein
MGAYKGTVTRPSNGQWVNWVLAPGLVVLGHQLDALGVTWYSIGNSDHLDDVPGGGHTPWKPGAPFGMVTAIDVMKEPYSMVEKDILKLMKTPSYDTSWIDFINTNGHQYDWDGTYQQDSGDYHLHLETLGSHTNFTSNLFYDMFGWPGLHKPPTTTPPVYTGVLKEDDMVLVKISSRDDVWKAEGDKLYHLTPAQFKAAKAAGYPVKTVSTQEELALFGTEIVQQETTVKGF